MQAHLLELGARGCRFEILAIFALLHRQGRDQFEAEIQRDPGGDPVGALRQWRHDLDAAFREIAHQI